MATLADTTSLLEASARGRESVRALHFSETLLLTCTQVVKWTLRLAFVLIVTRVLGPARFGIYALLFAMVEFLVVASGSGYRTYLTREAGKDARVGWGLAFQLVLLRIAIAVPGAALEVGILALLHYPHTVLAGTAFMALTLVPRAFSEAVQGALRGVRRYAEYLIIEATLGGVLVLGAAILISARGDLRMVIAAERFVDDLFWSRWRFEVSVHGFT